MEEVVEIKNAQRKVVKRVRIPGYVLVRMDLTDESWGAVRHTPGVTGFVGHTHQPVPLTLDEVFSMLAPSLEPKTPPAAVLIKEAAGIEKGSGEPNREKVGRITAAQVRQIAERKMPDLNANDIDAASRIIAGTARSMGVDVEGMEGA